MRAQSRLLGLLATFVVCAVALSGIAAASASAEACLKVKSGEPSTFKERSTAGICMGALATSGYVKVVEEAGTPVTGEPGVRCYKVAAGEPSAWEDNKCTKAKTGGGFIKIALSPCEGTWAIAGQGSSLQKIAQQEVWIPGSNCNAKYESTGSGKGREVFGEEPANLKPSASGDTFIGTDEPPSEGQMKKGDEEANGKFSPENKEKEGQTVVIPVVQAAVAVIVHPPTGCTLTQITNVSLQNVWKGETKKWGEILPAPAGTCTGAITRVVRTDKSGTTFVFKTYLEEIAKGTPPCGAGTKTWKEYDTTTENTNWPESSVRGCPAGLSPVELGGIGGGEEVAKVKAKEGSIGYANLADARKGYKAKELEWLEVQNNGVVTTGVTYAPAGTGATEPREKVANANCVGTSYGTLPAVTIDDNWSGVNGAHTTATNYPICTLTYDVGLAGYETAGYGTGTKLTKGLITANYLQWVVSKTTGNGQTDIALSHDYAALPIGAGSVGEHAEGEAALVNSKA